MSEFLGGEPAKNNQNGFSKQLKITPSLQEKLAKAGVRNDQELLLHIPLRYEDLTQITPVGDLVQGCFYQIQVTTIAQNVQYRPRKQLLVTCQDAQGDVIVLRFLHFYPSHLQQLKEGAEVRVNGEVRMGYHGLEMVHPKFSPAGAAKPLAQSLTPIYSTTEALTQPTWRKLMGIALEHLQVDEILPDTFLHPSWPSLQDGIRFLHAPPSNVDAGALLHREHPVWERLKFEEMLSQQLSLHEARAKRALLCAPALLKKNHFTSFLSQLPFTLTDAQLEAWRAIEHDISQSTPMLRLLQGDVGSGKTVVCAMAVLQCVASGKQAAVMAPTEILANQLYVQMQKWLEPLGINVGWLVSSLSAKQKNTQTNAVTQNEVQVIVGTHALIQESVHFYDLGLAVIDEQHRFGVEQRLILRQKMQESVQFQSVADKSNWAPHMLMMSATPIPRTLALSYYADLDVAIIDQLPKNRLQIITKLVEGRRRNELMQRIALEVERDQKQVYWVCPLIEESETLQLQTAIQTFEDLTQAMTNVRVGLVHGRMSSKEKQATMMDFSDAKLDVLVATTVIEVGVDVPNATLMVIEHAERFGLAQLHQLRGRVGRGQKQSTCVLLYELPLSQLAKERLKIMYQTNDGFEIARKDLQLRGPGEFLGTRQSGVPLLRFSDPEQDAHILEIARDCAKSLLENSPDVAKAQMYRWMSNKDILLNG